ncbi:MAG: hypothetical protein MHMPM18_001448 [Marteilia pararefringens]
MSITSLGDSHHSQIMKTIRQKAKSFEKEIMDSPDKDLNIFIPVEILLPDLTADNVEAVNCENGADSSLPIGKKRFLLDSGPLLSASSYWEGIVPKFLLDNHNLYKEDENCSRFIKGSGHKINVSTSKSNFDRLLLQIYKKSVRADTNHKILQELEELNNNKFTSKDDLKILREFRDRMN